jgi:hypothetical protein
MATKSRSTKNFDKVLREFNHLCAMCGNPRPQVHHIDGNNSNNVEENLLSLCPNHHLLDAHSPTQPIQSEKLRLFREFKDPSILCPQFHPIFSRALFLINEGSAEAKVSELKAKSQDLLNFIEHLSMGPYYYNRLKELIGWVEPNLPNVGASSTAEAINKIHRNSAILQQSESDFLQRASKNRHQAVVLIIELLRFQDWRQK